MIRLRRGIVAGSVAGLVAVGLVVPSTAPASAMPSPPSTPSPTPTARDTSCGDVALIGVRGSGELGPGNQGWTPDPKSTDPWGVGNEVAALFKSINAAASASGRDARVVAIKYAANDVRVLGSNPRKYFADIATGVGSAGSVLSARSKDCPNETIVLAGYSQGAMVVHRVLQGYDRLANTTIRPRIAAALLIADGDRITHDLGAFYGTGHRISPFQGIGQGSRSLSGASPTKFTTNTGGRVIAVCTSLDVVCDSNVIINTAGVVSIVGGISRPGGGLSALLGAALFTKQVQVHLSYTHSTALAMATSDAVRRVLQVPLPTPRKPEVDATVGEAVSHQFTADASAPRTLQWMAGVKPVLDHPTGLPPGLGLSRSGLLSGTPTTTGSWTVPLWVRAVRGTVATPWIPSAAVITISAAPPAPVVWSQVSAGGAHSCGVTSSGAAYCWGDNADGQLGDGTTVSSATPVAVTGLSSGVTAIGAGTNHSCAVTTSGTVMCWGLGSSGQLGNGSFDVSKVPVIAVSLPSGVASISVGDYRTCAVTISAAAYCWGSGAAYALGNGVTTDSSVPVLVIGMANGVSEISSGYDDGCTATSDNKAYCWGYGPAGDLTDPGGAYGSSVPMPMPALGLQVAAVSAGYFFACGLTTTGAVACLGSARLGNGASSRYGDPAEVPGMDVGIHSMSAGYAHLCVVTQAGAVECLGTNNDGQLGNGTFISSWVPTAVSGLGSGVAAVSAGLYHSCAVTTIGEAYCWGKNPNGQLGDGTFSNSSVTPVAVQMPWNT